MSPVAQYCVTLTISGLPGLHDRTDGDLGHRQHDGVLVGAQVNEFAPKRRPAQVFDGIAEAGERRSLSGTAGTSRGGALIAEKGSKLSRTPVSHAHRAFRVARLACLCTRLCRTFVAVVLAR